MTLDAARCNSGFYFDELSFTGQAIILSKIPNGLRYKKPPCLRRGEF